MPFNSDFSKPIQVSTPYSESKNAVSGYATNPLDQNTLMTFLKNYYNVGNNALWGAQQRAMGSAGSLGAGRAMSQGLNPAAYSQHARSDVAQNFANQFGNLNQAYFGAMSKVPETAFQSQLSANGQNFSQRMAYLNYLLNQNNQQFNQEQAGTNNWLSLLGGGLGFLGSII